jgi:hypothetical protein
VLVEALVTQSAVEALHEAILHRFAGRNVVPFDITLLLPGQDGVRGQLGAVVADDHSGVAPQFGDTIQLTCDPQTGERGVDHQGQAFSGEVIDQREDAEAPSAHQRVRHEVERPTQIAVLGNRHRRPCTESPFAATALAHHQPLFLVEPVELLAIELDALAFQHQTKTTIAEPPPLGRQLSQLPAKPFIERPL